MSDTPTSQLFVSQKELDLLANLNYEAIERVVGQTIRLYRVDGDKTNAHPIYGESTSKIYKEPIDIKALVYYDPPEPKSNEYSTEVTYSIKVYFHKRALKERVGVYPHEGDYIQWGTVFYEITSVQEPQIVWGRIESRILLEAHCRVARADEVGLTSTDKFEDQVA